jgi:membrane dipeptidase
VSSAAPSAEARAIARASEVIDLHLDTFITVRVFGWDIFKRHGRGLHGGRMFGHLDLPRMKDGCLTGGMWSITTNPFRTQQGRWRTFLRNVERMRELVSSSSGQLALVRTLSEYKEARARGAHAVMLSVQGGNCFDGAPQSFGSVPDRLITRVTLVHLTSSQIGATSSPFSMLRADKRLTEKGRELIRAMNAERAFVDLAHIHPLSFWDAVEVHDKTQPLIATHTGVSGVKPHWRNLDDRQIKTIADSGGTIGIIYAANFLRRSGGPRDADMVLEHMEHVIKVAGEDFVSIGSDLDGAITPPRDLRGADTYVWLVERMLRRGWPPDRIRKALGLNYLRAFGLLRP